MKTSIRQSWKVDCQEDLARALIQHFPSELNGSIALRLLYSCIQYSEILPFVFQTGDVPQSEVWHSVPWSN